MIIDSDDEPPPARHKIPYKEDAKFEEEEILFDPTEPRSFITQDLDLTLGTEVLQLAFPQVPADYSYHKAMSLPSILSNKIVIAAACADNNIRVITLPLKPPSPASKSREELRSDLTSAYPGNGYWGETMVTIGGDHCHQTIPDGITITFSPRPDSSNEETHTEIAVPNPHNTRSRSPAKHDLSKDSLQKEQHWDLLVASHSAELSGLLLVFRIPLVKRSKDPEVGLDISTAPVQPMQRQHLPSPATCISFNTSPYPAARHSHILVAERTGVTRIYNCLSSTRTRPPSRGSEYGSTSSEQGSWLISLYPSFISPSPSTSVAHRKPIIGASWVLAGKAIIILLGDGEWGIWDIEGAGPTAKGNVLLRGNEGTSGVRGGAKTVWSISGLVETSTITRGHSRSSSDSKRDSTSSFAPMTPHSRKVRQETLFSHGDSIGGPSFTSGGISVRGISKAREDDFGDDTIVMWREDTVVVMQSLITYWKAHLRNEIGGSGSLFGVDTSRRLVKVEGLNLCGDNITNVDIFPIVAKAGVTAPPDLVVAGQYRFVCLVQNNLAVPLARRASKGAEASEHTEERQLMATGNLDVSAIDRALFDMENNQGQSNGAVTKRKSVMFQE